MSLRRRVTCVSSCIVSSPWPEAFARHVRVLINPANDALIGPQRSSFPRGGPVPPPPTAAYSSDYSAAAAPATTTGLGWRLFGRIWADFGTEQRQPVMDDLLYPDQARRSAPHQPSPLRLAAAAAPRTLAPGTRPAPSRPASPAPSLPPALPRTRRSMVWCMPKV